MDVTFEIVDPDEHHPNHYLVLAALEPGLSTARVKVYNEGDEDEGRNHARICRGTSGAPEP